MSDAEKALELIKVWQEARETLTQRDMDNIHGKTGKIRAEWMGGDARQKLQERWKKTEQELADHCSLHPDIYREIIKEGQRLHKENRRRVREIKKKKGGEEGKSLRELVIETSGNPIVYFAQQSFRFCSPEGEEGGGGRVASGTRAEIGQP